MVGEVVKNTADGGGGLGYDSRADQVKHSAANGSPPLVAQELSRGDRPATRDTLRSNTASIMKK